MPLNRPKLATGVRLHRDKVREQDVLLFPEGALVLNETAVEVLELCDGERTLASRAERADVAFVRVARQLRRGVRGPFRCRLRDRN